MPEHIAWPEKAWLRHGKWIQPFVLPLRFPEAPSEKENEVKTSTIPFEGAIPSWVYTGATINMYHRERVRTGTVTKINEADKYAVIEWNEWSDE